MRGRLSHVLLGALVGVVCALAIGQWQVRRMRREQEAFQQALKDSVDRGRADAARIAMANVMAQAAAGPAPAASSPAARQPATPVVTDKVPSREEMWQGVQVHIQKHLSDPVDTAWATRVTPALESDLKVALADTKATLGSLSCRSTSCLGELDWPSLAQARDEVKKMIFAPLRVNCGRTAVIPPDATDDKAPVRMDVLFDCSAWKAKGSEIAESAPRDKR